MRIARFLFTLLSAAWLAACVGAFFDYQREYVVEYDEPLSSVERRAVFEAFKAYVKKQGRLALFERDADGVSSVTFRTHRVGYGPESDLRADALYLKYTDTGTFSLRVHRQTVVSDEFTAEGLATFVADMEAAIQAASGKKVHLRAAAGGT